MIRRRAKDKHNFLEDLIVTGLLDKRAVPVESGVRFYVGNQVREKGMCLLFSLDWDGNPALFESDSLRADYLTLFIPLNSNPVPKWVATVVELKGSDGHNQAHGVKQINTTVNRLRAEVQASLPPKIPIHWQGVLLHAGKAEVPLTALVKSQVPIVTVSYHHAVDLEPVVTSLFSKTQKFLSKVNGKNLSDPLKDMWPLERLLCCGTKKGGASGPTQDGICLSASNDTASIALTMSASSPQSALTGTSEVLNCVQTNFSYC